MFVKITPIAGKYVGQMKVRGEAVGYYAHGQTRNETIDRLFSNYWLRHLYKQV